MLLVRIVVVVHLVPRVLRALLVLLLVLLVPPLAPPQRQLLALPVALRALRALLHYYDGGSGL